MSLAGIKALTVDTGGTVLDWHSCFCDAFAAAGHRHGIERNRAALANDLRRRSMKAVMTLGETGPLRYNFDDAHHFCLDAFDETDRHAIAREAPHGFNAWPDVKEVLAALGAAPPVIAR